MSEIHPQLFKSIEKAKDKMEAIPVIIYVDDQITPATIDTLKKDGFIYHYHINRLKAICGEMPASESELRKIHKISFVKKILPPDNLMTFSG